MNCSILICSYGSSEWEESAFTIAYPSTCWQGAREVIVRHDPEGTLASVRNAAAEHAEGEWLCFLDADDELGPDYLRSMARAVPGEGRYLLAPSVSFVSGRRRQAPRIPAHGHLRDLKDGNWLVIGTLVQREVFIEVGGFEEWPIYEDWCLWQRCWKAGAEIVEVPEAVYVAHARPRSRNRDPRRPEKLRVHHEIVAANFPDA